jgi:hypothetical protein
VHGSKDTCDDKNKKECISHTINFATKSNTSCASQRKERLSSVKNLKYPNRNQQQYRSDERLEIQSPFIIHLPFSNGDSAMKRLIVVVLTVGLFSNCSQINLSNQEAQALIVKTLKLPQRFTEEINANSPDLFGAVRKYQKLEEEGFVYKSGDFADGFTLSATDKGQPYLIREGKSTWNGKNTLIFQAFDIDFDQVSGIAINKEQQTATVRFSLKATNVSPISRLLEENIDNPRNGELVFKKFDTGWQLANDQNKSDVDFVREIWWGSSNRRSRR